MKIETIVKTSPVCAIPKKIPKIYSGSSGIRIRAMTLEMMISNSSKTCNRVELCILEIPIPLEFLVTIYKILLDACFILNIRK